tara:strand:+ start:1319 stop:2260 length:942 start_codon:yes stop_codon:yes gene_type:complete
MQDHEKAPYLELDNYKAPIGIKSNYIKMKDGKRIRLISWKLFNDNEGSGTILIQQGHNEFIEKYYETIQEFIDRKYNVVAFDWRGQGMSERMIDDNRKQYIEDLNIHIDDLEFILNNVIFKNFNKPLIGIGHSMGGCIILSALKFHADKFDKIILSAPMLGFRSEKLLMILIDIFYLFLPKNLFLPGSKPNMGKETPFNENDLTTDEKRYKRTQKLVRLKKDIRLWGITIAWAKAVKNQFKIIRNEEWLKNIKSEILIINSTNDRVVSSKHIIETAEKLRNKKIINFKNCEHEIFMEKDIHRKKLWREIDNFL